MQIVPDLPSQDPPPEIVRVVAEIARLGGFIDALRCQELKRCCGAEDIARETPKFGLRFQNIGNYWHLLPVGFAPEQGLRYETTTPVKLCHGQTEKDHVDRKFSSSTIEFVIDGHPVLGEFLGQQPPEDHMNYHDSEWYSNHVRESQYFLQVVKCNNMNCCTPMRSNLRNVLPNGFFSAPYPFKRGSTGLWIPNSSVVTGSDDFAPFLVRQAINIKPSIVMATGDLPYDQFCPSVKTQVA
ncbi:unnamed protein product, partial [Nesidiocoris tenuis]